jgi:hypothetical protein
VSILRKPLFAAVMTLIGIWAAPSVRATLVVASNDGFVNLEITKSMPGEFASGHTTYFFTFTILDPNMEFNSIDAEFNAPSVRQHHPFSSVLTPFEDTNGAIIADGGVILADSQFEHHTSEFVGGSDVGTVDSTTQLKSLFSLIVPITDSSSLSSRTFAHLVLPNADIGDAVIEIVLKFSDTGEFVHMGGVKSTFTSDGNMAGHVAFDATSVGNGAAVPETGVIIFWMAASTVMCGISMWRRSRVTRT